MGSGFKTFTAGSVLTASDVQNYLQDQAVMVFGGTAARSSAIGTANFEEGMLTYLTDVDKLQVYTGSSFQDVYPPAATSQGLTLINTTSFSAVSSISLPANSFSATYENYRVLLRLTSISADQSIYVKMRASGTDNSTAYYYIGYGASGTSTVYTSGASAQTTGHFIGNTDGLTNSSYYGWDMHFFDPFAAKPTPLIANYVGTTTGGLLYGMTTTAWHDVSASYDSINIIASAGNFTGSISCYGFSK